MKKIQRSITGVLLATAVMCLVSFSQISAQDGRTKEQLLTFLQEEATSLVFPLNARPKIEADGFTPGSNNSVRYEWANVTEILYKGYYIVRVSGMVPGKEGIQYAQLVFRQDAKTSDMDPVIAALRRLVSLSKMAPGVEAKTETRGATGKESSSKNSNVPATGPTKSGTIVISDESHKKAEAARKELEARIAKQRAKDVADAARARESANKRGTASSRAEANRRWKAALIACFGSASPAAQAKAGSATVTCQ